MYRLKKNIFISGTAFFKGDVAEIDNISAAELLRKGVIDKVEPVSEVSIKPKRKRRKAD